MASNADEQVAKANRLRVFRKADARVLEDIADEAAAVRKNMAAFVN